MAKVDSFFDLKHETILVILHVFLLCQVGKSLLKDHILTKISKSDLNLPRVQSRDDVLPAVDVEQTEVVIRVSQKVPREVGALRLPRHRRRRPHRPRLGQRPPPIPRVSLQEAEVCCTRDLRRDQFYHLRGISFEKLSYQILNPVGRWQTTGSKRVQNFVQKLKVESHEKKWEE